MNRQQPVHIVGGGPTGALLAILLSRHGFSSIDVYESRPDPRQAAAESGRSINLALAARGIHALKAAGVFHQLSAALLPMSARCIHDSNGATTLQPYGQQAHEVNYSISRERLNRDLIDIAARRAGVRLHFEHRLQALDFAQGQAEVHDLRGDTTLRVAMQPLLAADGAGSVVRRALAQRGLLTSQETELRHGYKELAIPAGVGATFRMAREALHIWPRGAHMLIALPNDDGSFTATLFLPKHGARSFESLREPQDIERFLRQNFPDAVALMPDCVSEFQRHPLGFLGSVSAAPWHHLGQALLIGDAAHAMVPFHGQGMNCCFEDCVEFAQCTERHATWQQVFADFNAARKPNTDAIAAMALENYQEMRERVSDPRFRLQQALAFELERRFPQRFIPRYSMVMFHHRIPYLRALQRGLVQTALLDELTQHAHTLADVDFTRAALAIEARLPPL